VTSSNCCTTESLSDKCQLRSHISRRLRLQHLTCSQVSCPCPPANMGKGALAIPWKCCIMFLYISMCISYTKTLNRRNMYASFTQPAVGFWGFALDPPQRLHPWTLLGTFVPKVQTPNLPTPGKNPAGAHGRAVDGESFGRQIDGPRLWMLNV